MKSFVKRRSRSRARAVPISSRTCFARADFHEELRLLDLTLPVSALSMAPVGPESGLSLDEGA